MSLELILVYKMDELEAKAYKIGLLWEKMSQESFPGYKHMSKFPKKGDPRKSSLFRYCYKLAKTIDEKTDIKLYIKAQLDIFKALAASLPPEEHPLVNAGILVGDKAEVRWSMWKNKFDKTNKIVEVKSVSEVMEIDETVLLSLKDTKRFLDKKNLNDLLNSGLFKKWIKNGMINPYFAILSRQVNDWLNENRLNISYFEIDPQYHIITPGIKNIFKSLFGNENTVA